MGLEKLVRNVKIGLFSLPFIISSCSIQKPTYNFHEELNKKGSLMLYDQRSGLYKYITPISGSNYYASAKSEDKSVAIRIGKYRARKLGKDIELLPNYDLNNDKIISVDEYMKAFSK